MTRQPKSDSDLASKSQGYELEPLLQSVRSGLTEGLDFPLMHQESSVRRVLVVDDEALIRWSVAQTLGDQGFEVEQASSARGALDVVAACQGRFDVVVLDFRLPDSNDLKLMTELRRLMPRASVILMTAFSTPEMIQGALALGAVDVVSKPFEMTDMARLVRQAR